MPVTEYEYFMRIVIERLDEIIDILRNLPKPKPTEIEEVLRLLTSAVVPASPNVTRELTIGTTASIIIQNLALPFARVDITDDDPAQPLWLGGRDVTTNIGRVVQPRTTVPYVLPMGAELYGVCNVATISIRVSELYEPYGILKSLGIAAPV